MKMNHWYISAVVFTNFILTQHLFSQDTDSLTLDSTDRTIVFEPVFVYSFDTRQLFSVSSVDRKSIMDLTEPSIAGVLNAVPGVWMQSGTINTNRISIRGVGYREPFATTGIKVYLDEIPLTNGVGEASIEDINPRILSGIDVWRGPSSAVWGSGLGGMLHLRSDIPDEDHVSTHFQIGSYDRLQFDQLLSFKYGKKENLRTSLLYQFANDNGFRENNQYKKHSLTWLQQWDITGQFQLRSFIHALDLKAFIPSSLHFDDYTQRPAIAAPTWQAVYGNEDYQKWITGIQARYSFHRNWIYRSSVFYTSFQSDEVRPFNVLKEGNNAFGTRQRMIYSLNNVVFTGGLEFYKEIYDFSTFETLAGGERGMKLTDQHEDRAYLNGFIQAEWKFGERINAFTGINVALSEITNAEKNYTIPASVYPTSGISYRPVKSILLSLSVGRGYSAIGLDDILSSSGQVNHDIVPESGWNKELSFAFAPAEHWYFKVNAYTMNIENTILTRRIQDDIFEKINGGSSLHRGVELELKYQWLSILQWKGTYSYGKHSFKDFNDAGNDYSGNILPGTPEHHAFQQLEWNFMKSLTFHADHQFVSDVFLTDANTIKGKGYQVLNAGIEYSFLVAAKWKITVKGSVHNIFDIRYSPMFQINAPGSAPRYYYPGKPRSFYIDIHFDL